MESSKRHLLLGELFSALSQQHAAIYDSVDEEEKKKRESDGRKSYDGTVHGHRNPYKQNLWLKNLENNSP
ncbi:hypothetical protein NPX13_g10457 [Xylaria arbuscula]|uniref:Uncharacterized protein n=1 Tax=Xylaria arbuscula TaxID=114810 RepID=A0A9W8TI02_9PEZI|nr:hypothetical protein NPX13_g10457 [Xylaria arbuscula]